MSLDIWLKEEVSENFYQYQSSMQYSFWLADLWILCQAANLTE